MPNTNFPPWSPRRRLTIIIGASMLLWAIIAAVVI